MITITLDKPSNEEIPSLEEMIKYYKSKRLLFSEETIRALAPKIKEIPLAIPNSEIEKQVALITVWPLIERYNILFEGIGKDLTKEDNTKVGELVLKFKGFYLSEDRKTLLERMTKDEHTAITFLNPYNISRDKMIRTVLSVMCEPLITHIKTTTQSHTKIINDAQMGGTLYTAGYDVKTPVIPPAEYSFLQRSFVCVNERGEPVIFMDNIEGGEPFFKTLDHWRGYDEEGKKRIANNRVYHVYEGLAAAMFLAEKLGIRFVLPRDYELSDLTKALGARERTVFSKEQENWKIGLHSRKSHSGVYVHTLYRGGLKNRDGSLQKRFRVMTGFPFKTPSDMLGQLETLAKIIIEPNIARKKLVQRTEQRLDAMMALYDIINNLPTTQPFIEDQAIRTVTAVYDTIGRNPPVPYTS